LIALLINSVLTAEESKRLNSRSSSIIITIAVTFVNLIRIGGDVVLVYLALSYLEFLLSLFAVK